MRIGVAAQGRHELVWQRKGINLYEIKKALLTQCDVLKNGTPCRDRPLSPGFVTGLLVGEGEGG